MRIKTANELRKEITALDLALKMLRAETEGLRRSTITLKKATNAPLALWEEHWFGELPQVEQDNINRTARMIGNALANRMNHAPAVNNTITSATPAKPADKKPAKRTRKPSNATLRNQRWTAGDDKLLKQMVKAKETHQQMSIILGRSIGAIQQRITILKKAK